MFQRIYGLAGLYINLNGNRIQNDDVVNIKFEVYLYSKEKDIHVFLTLG